MQTLNVLNKGQVVIPAELRQRLGIKPGHVIEIRDAGDHLELYPLPIDPLQAFSFRLRRSVNAVAAIYPAFY
ncbi:MAG: AbrB/MazE/SpoVT family DNA-binding domain-containing protein [Methylococcaceae bacterium]|nr:AbrB/MazE/SpoVT family DNA-binding domain-containing protein [Methylococcaceae bacterium]